MHTITNSRMAAVLASPEFWWMKAGSSSDVIVKDNRIKRILQTPIQIRARGGNGRPLPAGVPRNISIFNNRTEDCAWPLIHVTSTEGLNIEGNVYPTAYPAWQRASSGEGRAAILLEQCEGIASPK